MQKSSNLFHIKYSIHTNIYINIHLCTSHVYLHRVMKKFGKYHMNNLYSISSGFKRHKRSTLFSSCTNMFPIMFFNFFVISNGINGIKFIKPFTIICFFQYFFSLFVFGTFSNKTVIDVSCLRYHLYLHLR